MDRRDFIRQMGLGLAAGWAFGMLSWPSESWATPELRLALLADAHLKNGAGRRPEAKALARAVAEINALRPLPDLVLFAGDLAHKGRPDALDLGREILAGLSAPLWAVRGEGDLGRSGTAPWVRRFGSPCFSRAFQGVHFLGLDTVLLRTSSGAVFEIGHDQRQWLAQELARLDSATPLVIVSHAPLARLFHPWHQWTEDAATIAPLLARFRQVLCLHGHVHGAGADNAGVRGQGPGASNNVNDGNNFGTWYFTENRKLKTENPLHLSLPATAWPLPAAAQGTPAIFRPGLSPHGCGWVLVTMSQISVDCRPHLWQA